jgi:hypothetical protein
MIYLIFTASLQNRYGSQSLQREKEYHTAIGQTLKHLPTIIQPIIVENNGHHSTSLEQFTHDGRPVPVVYTQHNDQHFLSKGITERMDLLAVIEKHGIQPDDMIIKLTGRYSATTPFFFEEVLKEESNYDALVKFYGSCSLKFERFDCILGMYAIRCKFLVWWNPYLIEQHPSAEVAFARYIRFGVGRFKEMERLDLHCVFAEDGRTLDV